MRSGGSPAPPVRRRARSQRNSQTRNATSASANSVTRPITTQGVELLFELLVGGAWVGVVEVKTCLTSALETENDRVASTVFPAAPGTPGTTTRTTAE